MAETKPHIRPRLLQRKASAQGRRAPALEEIGTTGLRHYGGYVHEEWLARLSGKRGAWAYREMADNDPVIGAVLFAIEMLARGVDWNVEPGEDEGDAEFVEQCKDDMSHTWEDFIAEVLSMLTYGWDWHELVYKRRLGPEPRGTDSFGRPLPASRYDDGRIGWRKIPTRAQETLEQWEFAEDGGLDGMTQVAYDGVRRTIPIEKSLLFRTTTRRGNPEGRSILRNSFVPHFRKKNIEEVEAIGIERDLAGLPVMTPPDGYDITAPAHAEIVAAAQEVVTGIKRDEDEGVLLPAGWKLELLSGSGARGTDPDKTIRRYDQRIATTVLADFILLAQDTVGSFALGKIKIDTFGQAMQAWLQAIAAVLNRYAIPRLLRLNGRSVTDPPRLVPGEVGQLDADALASFLNTLHLAGAPIDWSYDLMCSLYKAAGLPEPDESAVAEMARGGDGLPGPYDDPAETVVPDGGENEPPDDGEDLAEPAPKAKPRLKPKPKPAPAAA